MSSASHSESATPLSSSSSIITIDFRGDVQNCVAAFALAGQLGRLIAARNQFGPQSRQVNAHKGWVTRRQRDYDATIGFRQAANGEDEQSTTERVLRERQER